MLSARRSPGTPVGPESTGGPATTIDGVETRAPYDEVAEWYDERLGPFTARAEGVVRELLGHGAGRCLDVGCGTGYHLPLLHSLGYEVTGVDISAEMLDRAKARARDGDRLVQANAASLPFADGEFDAATAMFIHTDVGDYSAVLLEIARVLRPGGRFLHVGLHPCFAGPFSRYQGDDEPPLLFHGYRQTEWTNDAQGFGEGLRRIVGARHLPLADLLNALALAGFRLEQFDEPAWAEFPRVLAVAARKP